MAPEILLVYRDLGGDQLVALIGLVPSYTGEFRGQKRSISLMVLSNLYLLLMYRHEESRSVNTAAKRMLPPVPGNGGQPAARLVALFLGRRPWK